MNVKSIYWHFVAMGTSKLFYNDGRVPQLKTKKGWETRFYRKKNLNSTDVCVKGSREWKITEKYVVSSKNIYFNFQQIFVEREKLKWVGR